MDVILKTTEIGRIPPGTDEENDGTQDLLSWMGEQFQRFGDIYRAVIYGANVYVTRDPQHAEHVLRENWQYYTKGLFSKRVAILLGNGLMSSEGTLWKKQRRMIQPAFHRNVVAGLAKVIASSNRSLLTKWKEAALQHIRLNVTHDVSSMVLEVTLRSIFGNDYLQVAEHFKVLSEESTRDLKFAQAFRSLEKIVFLLAAERRKKMREPNDLLSKLMAARDLSGQAMRDRGSACAPADGVRRGRRGELSKRRPPRHGPDRPIGAARARATPGWHFHRSRKDACTRQLTASRACSRCCLVGRRTGRGVGWQAE